jgi:hypothetical protein
LSIVVMANIIVVFASSFMVTIDMFTT